jgi:hypothetical protein
MNTQTHDQLHDQTQGHTNVSCTAFAGMERIATGALAQVAIAVKNRIDRDGASVLVFDDATGNPIEVDFRGSAADVRRRLAASDSEAPTAPAQSAPRGPGRPKLGVTAREVTLLPRHWDWLNAQPGGASVALRKLVDQARHGHAGRDRVRQAQEVTYRFMSVVAGNLYGYEEAMRALFAGDRGRFIALIEPWPADVRDHIVMLASAAFPIAA